MTAATNSPENSGHRQRLRDRFLAGDVTARTEEALLELLLTYAIPLKDVQPLAKKLIEEFGGLSGVLAAPHESLCRVAGIKSTSAVLIRLVGALRDLHASGSSAKHPVTQVDVAQKTLFEEPRKPSETILAENKAPRTKHKAPQRKRSELFTNAVLKEAIELLPGIPDTDSLDEVRAYLQGRLHFSGESTRNRFALYITRRAFPEGHPDRAMRLFAKHYANNSALNEVCFYRFLKSEPLVERIAHELLIPSLSAGQLRKQRIRDYLKTKFPGSPSVRHCMKAIVAALAAGGVANAERDKITFGFREISLPAFAFVLHSEFPEPGMYDLEALETNRTVLAMLWSPSRIVPSVYELRNQGIISKVSEIDRIRQFTTKWTLEQVVEHLVSVGQST